MTATYWRVIPNDILSGTNIIFRLLCTKGVYPNGIIEAIKYSTFEGSAQNEVVDGYELEMNISAIDFTRFLLR